MARWPIGCTLLTRTAAMTRLPLAGAAWLGLKDLAADLMVMLRAAREAIVAVWGGKAVGVVRGFAKAGERAEGAPILGCFATRQAAHCAYCHAPPRGSAMLLPAARRHCFTILFAA